MEWIATIFGEGKELTVWQMSARGVVVFILALVLLRISGRRSFKLGTPIDTIISISLGAILSRAVVGVSPFLPVMITCFVIVILHRIVGMLVIHNKRMEKMIEGDKILLFEKGKFIKSRLRRALISEEDVRRGIRKNAQTENLNEIEKVYMERNGEITVIRKAG